MKENESHRSYPISLLSSQILNCWLIFYVPAHPVPMPVCNRHLVVWGLLIVIADNSCFHLQVPKFQAFKRKTSYCVSTSLAIIVQNCKEFKQIEGEGMFFLLLMKDTECLPSDIYYQETVSLHMQNVPLSLFHVKDFIICICLSLFDLFNKYLLSAYYVREIL